MVTNHDRKSFGLRQMKKKNPKFAQTTGTFYVFDTRSGIQSMNAALSDFFKV
jgi:hypothetical protein